MFLNADDQVAVGEENGSLQQSSFLLEFSIGFVSGKLKFESKARRGKLKVFFVNFCVFFIINILFF